MSVREYIGARYVPLFADPLEWDATRTYEPLTVVLYQGNSYTSRQAVPANIPITNTTYWAQTGNYNAQVEQYRTEVQTFDGRITANTNAISSEATARQNADTALAKDISDEETARTNAITAEATARANADTQLSQDISTETTARINADNALRQRITDLENYKPIILLFGDSYCVTGVGDGRGNIYEQLDARLGRKYQIINKSVGGAAFADIGDAQAPYILQQVNAAIADTSFDHSEVDFCVIVGGRNDGYRGTAAQSIQGVSDVGSALRTNFTNAKIVFGIGNWTGQKLTTGAYKFFEMQMRAKNIAGCVCTDGLWRALLTGDDVLAPQSTNYHPTPSGMWRITNLLIAAMFGGDAKPTAILTFSNPFTNCAEARVRINGSQTQIIFTLNGQNGSAVSLSDGFNRVMPSENIYAHAVSVATAANGGGGKGLAIRFNSAGTVQTFPSDGATAQLPFDFTTVI